jgi:hypothetical protein
MSTMISMQCFFSAILHAAASDHGGGGGHGGHGGVQNGFNGGGGGYNGGGGAGGGGIFSNGFQSNDMNFGNTFAAQNKQPTYADPNSGGGNGNGQQPQYEQGRMSINLTIY